MKTHKSLYQRHRFPPDVIQHAVWLYHRFSLSFRDIEDLLAERGVTVSYETVRRWCSKFGHDTRVVSIEGMGGTGIPGMWMRCLSGFMENRIISTVPSTKTAM